jgi:hypothetical protein
MIREKMPSMKNAGGNNPLRDRYALAQHHSPVVIYDVSKSGKNKFFVWLGKLTFLGVIALLMSMAIVWALHRPNSTNSAAARIPALTNPAGNSSTAPELAPAPPTVQAPASGIGGPTVMNVASWGVTGSGANVSWSTNQPSTTALTYGTTSGLEQVTPTQKTLAISHGVSLTGLRGGTKYYFVAQSANANGIITYSSTYSFTTVVTTPPTISGIVVTPAANNHARISWATSVPANSYVQYGPTEVYGSWSKKTELTTHPQSELDWVRSGVVHYHLVSTDALGNQAVSPDYKFVEP